MKQEDREIIEQLLLEILGGNFELFTEKASKIIDVLDGAPERDQESLLTFVLRVSHLAPESDFVEKGRKMTDERFAELTKTILSDIRKVFHVWIRQNPTEEVLAQKVWAYQKRFNQTDERDFFLGTLLRDSHTPYVQIPNDIYVIDDLDDPLVDAPGGNDISRFREATALIMNLLGRGADSEEALTVALWNIIDRQTSTRDKFMVFRIMVHMVGKNAEETTKAAISDALTGMLSQYIETMKSHSGVLGIAIDAKDLPPNIREFFEKMRNEKKDGGKKE
ncbi:MAG: hypothetical protein ABSE68_01335 [Minisyncoccia bacterium]